MAEAELRRGEGRGVERLDFDGDGAEELWIHAGGFSARVSPERGGVIEEYTVFEHGINYADVLTRRREVYHEAPPAPDQREGEPTRPPADGTPSIHELEQMARLQQLPPVDQVDRALFVDRVLAPDVTLDAYAGGAFASIVCWSRHTFEASLEHSADAVEVVLRPGAAPSGGGGPLRKRPPPPQGRG